MQEMRRPSTYARRRSAYARRLLAYARRLFASHDGSSLRTMALRFAPLGILPVVFSLWDETPALRTLLLKNHPLLMNHQIFAQDKVLKMNQTTSGYERSMTRTTHARHARTHASRLVVRNAEDDRDRPVQLLEQHDTRQLVR